MIRSLDGITVVCIAGVVLLSVYLMRRKAGLHRDRLGSWRQPLIVPETLHMAAFLEQMLPGFRWLTPTGFVIDLGEAFLYDAYTGLVFTPIHNRLWRRWAEPE